MAILVCLGNLGLAADLPLEASQILNGQCQLDFEMTRRAQASSAEISRAIYGNAPGIQIDVWLLRCNESLKKTYRGLDIPKGVKVKSPQEQDVNIALSMIAGMFGSILKGTFGEDWPDKAHAKAKEVSGQPLETFKVTIGNLDEDVESAKMGNRIEQIEIDGMNPWIDYRNLEVIGGTWAQVLRTSFQKPDSGRVSNSPQTGSVPLQVAD